MVELLLLADVDWIKGLVPIVALVIWVINHLIGASKVAQANRKAPRLPPKPIPRPQNPRGGANTEIEQFLKQADNRRRQKGRREAPSPAQPRQQQSKRPPRRLVEEPVDVEVIERRPVESISAHVEKHMAERMGRSQIGQRSSHLTDDIAQADRQREEHLDKAFSHQVGRLTDTSGAANVGKATDTAPEARQTASAVATTDLTALLRNMDTLRQTFILNEILQSPESRW